MNNRFVKDSLLPNEEIIATAKFHSIKDWLLPLFILIASAVWFAVMYNSIDDSAIASPYWKYIHTRGNIKYFYDESLGHGEIYYKEQNKWESFPNMTLREFLDMVGVSHSHEIETINTFYENDVSKMIIWWVITLALVIGLYCLIKWVNKKDEFVITNLRVVAKTGLIRRISFEFYNEQMESIMATQGIIGRLFNFGTVIPCGIGASKVRIPFIVNPFEFRQHFYDLKKPKNAD